MGLQDKLKRLEQRTTLDRERCPECGGKVLLIERDEHGIAHYPFEEPCSTCHNIRPDGGIGVVEIRAPLEVSDGGVRDKLKRLQRATEGELEHFELLDGSRYYFDPLSWEIFLHWAACIRAGSAHNWPPAPEVVQKLTEAKDLERALERVRGDGGWNSFVYDEEILVRERRLVPRALVVERDPDTGEWHPRDPYEEHDIPDLSSQARESREDGF